MAQLLLSRYNHLPSHARHRIRQPISMQIRFGKFFLMFSMLILGGLMSMLYLMNFTDAHTKGYQLRKLEISREELLNQHEIKTMNVARVRSLSHIQESSTLSTMMPMRNPVFITDAPVAKRD